MSATLGTVLKLKNRSEMRVLARLDMNEPGLPQPTHSPLKNPQLRTREIVRYVMDHRTPVSSRQAKIRWLQANHVLWDGFSPDDRQNWSHIIKLMKAAGLVAATTYTFDVNLPSLIADAHGH